MSDLQENPVPATNQIVKNILLDQNDGDMRILFVGNSITRHGPKPDIGWELDCGMAASSPERDYVHVFAAGYSKIHPGAVYGILQVADFERGFYDFDIEKSYAEAINWKPNIVFMFFGANVSGEYDRSVENNRGESPKVRFGDRYDALRQCLDSGDTKFYHVEGYYLRPVLTTERRAVCEKHGDRWISLAGINDDAATHGLYNHPNDLGMRMIAERLLEATAKQ